MLNFISCPFISYLPPAVICTFPVISNLFLTLHVSSVKPSGLEVVLRCLRTETWWKKEARFLVVQVMMPCVSRWHVSTETLSSTFGHCVLITIVRINKGMPYTDYKRKLFAVGKLTGV